MTLANEFFVWGSVRRYDYGAAPAIQFNDLRPSDPELATEIGEDLGVFEEILGVGFFLYEPRAWMWGEVEPLKRLLDDGSRKDVIQRIVTEYGSMTLTADDQFYRVRKNPRRPTERTQYDSPPAGRSGGRLARTKLPVLYASPDLDTCLHECRVAVEDELYVATLRPSRDLKLLNVAAMLEEPRSVTEFESLDLAVYMLFLGGTSSYPITQAISEAAKDRGFDGLVYPSYFSMVRNGVKPFETTYGISHRRIREYRAFEEAKSAPNLAVFGRPVEEGTVDLVCINRVVLSRVVYAGHFGPVLRCL